MRLRRLAEAVLMLGVCLLLNAERLYGQREVIATSSPAPVPKPAAQPTLGQPSVVPASNPPPQAIQLASYTETNQAPPPVQMLPPNALLSGMPTGGGPAPTPPLRTGGTPVPPMPAPPPTGAPPVSSSPNPAMLSVEVRGPGQLSLGQPLVHEIVLRNRGGQPIAEVHVEEPLPAGVRVLKTDPPAVLRGNRLAWDLRHLEAGGERRLKIELNPSRPGEMDLRPYVSFLTGNGLHTQVVRPPFSIEMSADRTQATRGEKIRFRIQLVNRGDAPVCNINLFDNLPPELHHPGGPKLAVMRFGDLLPGQTRDLSLETTAVASGPFHNAILAQADRGVEAKASIDGVIVEPNLSLRLDGPTQTMTRREADFSLEVLNPAVLTAKNVRLVQTLPPQCEVVSASSNASFDGTQHALIWSLGELGTGQRQRVAFRIKVSAAGDWPMAATVRGVNFPEAHVKNSLHADAMALLKLDVNAREERLTVGEETVFRVHVLNKGDAPCTGVQLTAVLPDAVTLLEATGASKGQVEKQQIKFAPLPRLEAHGDVMYSLHVRGGKAGQGSLRVSLTAEKQTPAEREISVQVGEKATTAESANSSVRGTLR